MDGDAVPGPLQQCFTAFIMLFVVFDALGNVPIFHSLTEGLRKEGGR